MGLLTYLQIGKSAELLLSNEYTYTKTNHFAPLIVVLGKIMRSR
jgi:hypothetical protein